MSFTKRPICTNIPQSASRRQ